MKTVAIYPGSFNPFHKGHLDIVSKAEAIFDEVVIAIGINPDKPLPVHPETGKVIRRAETILRQFPNKKIIEFKGFLTDYVLEWEMAGYNVTVIRGIRNGVDLDFELTQTRLLEDKKPDIKTIFIPADIKYQHISSSAIRMLEKIQEGSGSEYLAKSSNLKL